MKASGRSTYFLGLLLELLNGSLVDSTAFVDQMSSGGRLPRVDVTDDDNVDVGLFLVLGRHLEGLWCLK